MLKRLTQTPPQRRLAFWLLAATATAVAAQLIPLALQHAETAREKHLKETLTLLRESLQQFHHDHGHYPASLDELVRAHYLRQLPKDPLTDRHDGWLLSPADGKGIEDVHSGASGYDSSGTPYTQW